MKSSIKSLSHYYPLPSFPKISKDPRWSHIYEATPWILTRFRAARIGVSPYLSAAKGSAPFASSFPTHHAEPCGCRQNEEMPRGYCTSRNGVVAPLIALTTPRFCKFRQLSTMFSRHSRRDNRNDGEPFPGVPEASRALNVLGGVS